MIPRQATTRHRSFDIGLSIQYERIVFECVLPLFSAKFSSKLPVSASSHKHWCVCLDHVPTIRARGVILICSSKPNCKTQLAFSKRTPNSFPESTWPWVRKKSMCWSTIQTGKVRPLFTKWPSKGCCCEYAYTNCVAAGLVDMSTTLAPHATCFASASDPPACSGSRLVQIHLQV